MSSYDLAEFLKLSAVLNYQLSARHINWDGIQAILLDRQRLSPKDREVFDYSVKYIYKEYGERKRRLGSLAVLHPLRVTTFLSRATKRPRIVELMTALLHDVYEDIKPDQVDEINWIHPDDSFRYILDRLQDQDRWYMMERLGWLTKQPNESYYQYIGRFLDCAKETPHVVRVKLADRLDNTLDLRIDLDDPLEGVDFFEIVFQILFNNSYTGPKPQFEHYSAGTMNGAERLYQLFKNIVLMSLVRQKRSSRNDSVSRSIFNSLAIASMKEAQRIVLHIISYHEKDVMKCRDLLLDTMRYVTSGGIESVTAPTPGYLLDGLIVSRFDDPDKKNLQKKLDILYEDKPLMIEASVAFIVIFLSFLNDPQFFVHGISPSGVSPTI